MMAITYLKTVSTLIFFLVIALPDFVGWLYNKYSGHATEQEDPFLEGDTQKPSLWVKARWTAVIIVAAFLRIASETVAPYFAKAYLVLFVQMWAPLLVALSGRIIFRVTLPYGFLPAAVAMALSAVVTLLGASEFWADHQIPDLNCISSPWLAQYVPTLTCYDYVGMLVALLGVLSIVVILYAVSWGKQILGDRFILFLIMSSMLLFAPWLSLIFEEGNLWTTLVTIIREGQWGWVVALGINNFCMVYFQNLALFNLGAPLVSIFIPLRLLVAILGSYALLNEAPANVLEWVGLTMVFFVTFGYLFTQYLAAVRRAKELSELGDGEDSVTRLGTPLSVTQNVDVLQGE